MTIEAGDQLAAGRFTLQRRIGRGGMAEVWLARDADLQASVALKVLFDHLRRDSAIAERFRREVIAARMLVHPNILRVFDLHDTPDAMFLSMEYISGGTVRAAQRERGRLPLSDVLRMGIDVCQGLTAAHRAGVVHRDIKPHNLLMGADGGIRIADFGLAQIQSLLGLTTHSSFLGTPEYAPPELLRGLPFDPRSDIYSLGVVLFELTTGRLPFRARSPFDLLRLHVEEPVLDVRDIDPELPEIFGRVIARCMAKQPADRFPTADILRQALEDIARAAPTVIVPVPGRTAPPPDPTDATEALTYLPAEAPKRRACPRCGEPMGRDMPLCLHCGKEVMTLAKVGMDEGGATEGESGRPRALILPRAPRSIRRRRSSFFDPTAMVRDYLTFEEKSTLVSVLEELQGGPVDELRADRRLRRPPVLLLNQLEEEQADRIAALFEEKGLTVRSLPLYHPQTIVASMRAGYGSVVPVAFFASVMMAAMLRLPLHWAIALVTLASAVAAPYLGRPLATLAGDLDLRPAARDLLRQGRTLLDQVSSPHLRDLSRGLIERSVDVERALEAARDRLTKGGDGEWPNVQEALVGLRDRIVQLTLAAQHIEEALEEIDERELLARLEEVDRAFEAAEDATVADEMLQIRGSLLQTLDEARQAERQRDRHVAQLLSIDGGLADLLRRLDLAKARSEGVEVEGVTRILEGLQATAEALEEVT